MKEYKHIVQYYETDKMGITHHSNYIRFMEEARVYYLNEIGYGFDRMEAEGIISPVVNVSCNYKKTTTFADEIVISVKFAEISRVSFKFKYTMTVKGEIVCTAESNHCFVSQAGRPINIQKQYPEIYETFCGLVEE